MRHRISREAAKRERRIAENELLIVLSVIAILFILLAIGVWFFG